LHLTPIFSYLYVFLLDPPLGPRITDIPPIYISFSLAVWTLPRKPSKTPSLFTGLLAGKDHCHLEISKPRPPLNGQDPWLGKIVKCAKSCAHYTSKVDRCLRHLLYQLNTVPSSSVRERSTNHNHDSLSCRLLFCFSLANSRLSTTQQQSKLRYTYRACRLDSINFPADQTSVLVSE
jgi:hypothetical protein